ncbi:hypothetical protein LTR91_020261 [Friedmanniomyces endolithicus]|uniref:Uncharacterized protein n=1 Tax=Friedmanniomyces endolithicus TaxID=329885 RepID=A0AAN6H873_9PEZI|nr:hypothetical protein LTR94_014194 [Friedmanniomyces endolithicus]KAK0771789.1 hypothetical protein LTR75_017590 [Friedmanniomyces endolithicus]KAK0799766.1 hypothetical protein LTR38_007415 [Friedmanniomyces endolithicus]KAK0802348.1 hypothetical protein LTR59_005084 [Friedmanniomyces endolithicus]KAK0837131.1 hypothetical protein LTR03_013091 [Friedmanniomyces endolithicus]
MAMEPPPPFRLSPLKSQPLHTLSPERVNAARTISTATTATKTTWTNESDADVFPPPREINSTHSSPIRRANLFADYHPATPNKSTTGFALPQSPSLPEIHALRSHVRTNSDVHGLVKRFEHLDVRDKDADSADRRRKHEAELRRAQIAREEAESDVRRLREELRHVKKESEDGRERERKVGRRLEVVMEEYVSAKEQHASQHSVYEKELRRARKEAYKSSSAVIKLQEELKSTRNSLRITQSGLDLEKQKVQRREQDTFSAQYQLAAVQEELDKLRAHLKIVVEEKEALKMTLKEDELSRIAAEGMIALPVSQEDDDDLMASPGKRSPLSDDKENAGVFPKKLLESKKLEEELLREQMRREHAEEMVEFLGLECMFRCCRCRTMPELQRHENLRSSKTADLAQTLDDVRASMKAVLDPHEDNVDVMDVETASVDQPQTPVESLKLEQSPAQPESPPMEEADRSMTMPVEEEEPIAPRPTPVEPEAALENDATHTTQPSSPPQTPAPTHQSHRPQMLRTITTTTTIPTHFTPISKPLLYHHPDNDTENIPPPSDPDNAIADTANADSTEPAFDRAAALAAIEYRRGRAKSFQAGHLTPRKQMLEGVGGGQRRDISAPALGGKTGGGVGVGKVVGSVGRAGRRVV